MEQVEEKPLDRWYDAGLVRWVWQFIRPYQGLFWLATFLMPLDTAFLLAQPYVIKLTVDEFLSGAHGAPPPAWLAILFRAAGGHGLFVMGGLYLLLVVCEFAAFYAQFYLMMMVAQFSLSDLRMALFRKVERLPMSFFDRTPVGRLVSRMTTDIDSINDMYAAGHRDDHVLVESAPGAGGAVRDTAADDGNLFPEFQIAHRLRSDPRPPRRVELLPVGSTGRHDDRAALHPRAREPARVRRAQPAFAQRADDGQRLRGWAVLVGRGTELDHGRGYPVDRRRQRDSALGDGGHADRVHPVRSAVFHAVARYLDQVQRAPVRSGSGREDSRPDGRREDAAAPCAPEAAGGIARRDSVRSRQFRIPPRRADSEGPELHSRGRPEGRDRRGDGLWQNHDYQAVE